MKGVGFYFSSYQKYGNILRPRIERVKKAPPNHKYLLDYYLHIMRNMSNQNVIIGL